MPKLEKNLYCNYIDERNYTQSSNRLSSSTYEAASITNWVRVVTEFMHTNSGGLQTNSMDTKTAAVCLSVYWRKNNITTDNQNKWMKHNNDVKLFKYHWITRHMSRSTTMRHCNPTRDPRQIGNPRQIPNPRDFGIENRPIEIPNWLQSHNK